MMERWRLNGEFLKISIGIKVGPVEEGRRRQIFLNFQGWRVLKTEMEMELMVEVDEFILRFREHLCPGTASASILQILDSSMVQLGETKLLINQLQSKVVKTTFMIRPETFGGFDTCQG